MDKPIKILIADDHKMVRNGVRLMLESQKVFKTIITEASNGFEVLHFLEKEQFDVVLLDISMPEMDGIKVLLRVVLANDELFHWESSSNCRDRHGSMTENFSIPNQCKHVEPK